MNSVQQLALALADACLAREASLPGLMKSMSWVLGKRWPWIPALCQKILDQTGPHFYHYSRHELAALILAERGFMRAWGSAMEKPAIRRYCLDAPIPPQKPAWLAALGLPELPNSASLAIWLQRTPGELAWFADQWRSDAHAPDQLQHYRYRWLAKPSGGMRLIEMPKLRLRMIQRQILRHILNRVPPHPAAHGFRPGYSCLTHASLHCGQRVVLRMDLKDFFTSISAARIQALFSKLAYPPAVAGLLARLCTHRTPDQVLRQAQANPAILSATSQQEKSRLYQALRSRHLPQGAPTSPALANLCAFRLDLRLAAMAKSLNARYSRYADDLTFSGGKQLEQALRQLVPQIGAIALEEGFVINFRKTRIMRQGQRQRVTGMVVNAHPNLSRADYDTLKAILTNCLRHGPASQNHQQHANFRAFLQGKVAWANMINPVRGARLAALLAQIVWPSE
ncbi:MAG: hypothetical protein RL748_1804 [Pseudomonadota bacterium]|jgi:retron-type reverse transcriptase